MKTTYTTDYQCLHFIVWEYTKDENDLIAIFCIINLLTLLL